jgi:hypothetical protein
MWPSYYVLFLALGFGLIGCGAGQEADKLHYVPVQGKLTVNGKSLGEAELFFFPMGETKGRGSWARTDPEGKFVLRGFGGSNGAVPGEYAVTVSRLVMPDGSDIPTVKPTKPLQTREIMPTEYTNRQRTPLKRTIPEEGGTIDIDLQLPTK